MEELMKAVSALAGEEYQRAAAEHGGAANTPHEGYALIKEEVEEAKEELVAVEEQLGHLWTEVKADETEHIPHYTAHIKQLAILGACELIQVAAMTDKAVAGLRKMEEGVVGNKIGLWKEHRYGTTLDPSCVQYYCSICGKVQEDFTTSYCPHCGAAMVGVEKE